MLLINDAPVGGDVVAAEVGADRALAPEVVVPAAEYATGSDDAHDDGLAIIGLLLFLRQTPGSPYGHWGQDKEVAQLPLGEDAGGIGVGPGVGPIAQHLMQAVKGRPPARPPLQASMRILHHLARENHHLTPGPPLQRPPGRHQLQRHRQPTGSGPALAGDELGTDGNRPR